MPKMRPLPGGWMRRACIVALMSWLAGAPAATADPRSVDEVRASGELVMLAFPHQESEFVRVDLAAGPMPTRGGIEHFDGLDVDLMAAFAEHLGVRLVVQPVSQPAYAQLIPDLLDGRGDLIASSFSITPARLEVVDFSRPYHSVYPVVVTLQDSDISTVEDLTTHRGAVMRGSSLEEALRELGVPEERLHLVDFSIECFVAVLEGEADYLLADSSSSVRALAFDDRLQRALRLSGEDAYAVALPRDSGLKPMLDAFLAELEGSGELAALIATHLQSRSEEDAAEVEPGHRAAQR
ncbi:MAG: transporter substrate-binding domain-containing protein [Acidobacteriota bacterium]